MQFRLTKISYGRYIIEYRESSFRLWKTVERDGMLRNETAIYLSKEKAAVAMGGLIAKYS